MYEVTVEYPFDFRSGEYADLFGGCTATAFQHPVWLAHFYEILAHEAGVTPLIIVVRRRDDRTLAMVVPLIKRRYGPLRVVEFADLCVSDYVSPVASPESFLQIVADQAACAAIRQHLAPYDLLRIGKLPETSLPLERLFGREKRKRMDVSGYASRLEGSFGAWRDKNLSLNCRKKFRKKSRQLGRKGEVRFARAETPAAIKATFDALRLYRQRRFGRRSGAFDPLQLPSYFDFYLSVALEGCGGFARTYTIWLDDQPIAGAFGLSYCGAFLVILVGFDEESHGRQSVGSLMFEQIARDCFEHGEQSLDFTIGDEPYKRRFGAEPTPMWSFCQASSTLGSGAKFIVETLPAGKVLARRLWRPR